VKETHRVAEENAEDGVPTAKIIMNTSGEISLPFHKNITSIYNSDVRSQTTTDAKY
jgi:hypothetical protein